MNVGRKAHAATENYLELLDAKLGFPEGTLYKRCVAAVKSKVEDDLGVTVTYRGIATREKRLSTHRYIELKKSIFLIEYPTTKSGKPYQSVVQVHLEL